MAADTDNWAERIVRLMEEDTAYVPCNGFQAGCDLNCDRCPISEENRDEFLEKIKKSIPLIKTLGLLDKK